MTRKGLLAGAAVGVAAVALAGAGGYWAQAWAETGAVNGGAVQTAAAGPYGSFADIVQKVAPAVVSIDVESKAKPNGVAFSQSGEPTPPQGFGGPGDQGNPFGFSFAWPFPQTPPSGELPPTRSSGSGFFISRDGYIVTNNHVVDGAEKITVRTTDGRELKAQLIGQDPATDLAVIKVAGGDFPYVDFEDRAKPRVGDWVVAVGNPFGLGGTATAGIVSALGRRDLGQSSYVDYMQIDAPINRGNSGGPTFDVYGRVVGVNTSIYSPSGGSVGIGFDIPADVVASVSRQLISTGKVVRGYIGATIQTVTPDIAASLDLATRGGALVADVAPGGPSQVAGLEPGDLILKVDGHDIASSYDLTRQVALAHPGDVIRLDVRRGGQLREVDVRSGARPLESTLLASNDRTGPQPDSSSVLGMHLQRNPDGGATIEDLASASDASQKGLAQGDVILRAGQHRVDTPADVSAAVAEAKRSGRKDILLLVAHAGRNQFVPLALNDSNG